MPTKEEISDRYEDRYNELPPEKSQFQKFRDKCKLHCLTEHGHHCDRPGGADYLEIEKCHALSCPLPWQVMGIT